MGRSWGEGGAVPTLSRQLLLELLPPVHSESQPIYFCPNRLFRKVGVCTRTWCRTSKIMEHILVLKSSLDGFWNKFRILCRFWETSSGCGLIYICSKVREKWGGRILIHWTESLRIAGCRAHYWLWGGGIPAGRKLAQFLCVAKIEN